MDNALRSPKRTLAAHLPLRLAISADWRNLAILTAAYGLLLLLLSPQHDYAVIDDWIYAQAVRHLQLTGTYALPAWAVVSLVGQVWWGRLFADLFGYNFTVLTWSTLVLSWGGVLCCYGLLRTLALSGGRALFGTLLLLLNPLYLHLSYSFMTDVPLLALLLGSALALVWGLQRDDDRLLLIAMLISGLAALIRQPGIAPTIALGAYLVLTRRLTGRRALIMAVPLVMLGLYELWYQGQPRNEGLVDLAQRLDADLASPAQAVWDFLIVRLLVLSTLGLWLLPLLPLTPAVRPGRRPLQIAGVLGLISLIAYAGITRWGAELPLDVGGNALTSHGFLVIDAPWPSAAPVLIPPVWWVISILAIGATAWFVAVVVGQAVPWLRSLWSRRTTLPARAAIWLLAGTLAIGGAVGFLFHDRYLLPLLPILAYVALRGNQAWGRGRWIAACLVLAAMGTFSLLAHADAADRAAARWQAGEQLLAQGIAYSDISGGFEWNGMQYYDEAGTRRADGRAFGIVGLAGLPYAIAEGSMPGYHTVGQVAYFSRLGGFTWRQVLLLERDPGGAAR